MKGRFTWSLYTGTGRYRTRSGNMPCLAGIARYSITSTLFKFVDIYSRIEPRADRKSNRGGRCHHYVWELAYFPSNFSFLGQNQAPISVIFAIEETKPGSMAHVHLRARSSPTLKVDAQEKERSIRF